MANQPGDRYPSCRALADDVERWMADESVSAYPEPWTRKLVRWLTRHRTGVTGAASAGLAALVGLAAVTAVQTRDRAALAGKNAELTAANARVSEALGRETAARGEAIDSLYQALLGETRAVRTAREVGYRGKVMDLLARAGRLDTSRRDPALLRRKAAAALGDFVGLDPADFDFRPGGAVRPWSLHGRSGRAAAAMTDGSVAVVDLMTLREDQRFKPGGQVYDLAFSADGLRLAVGTAGGTDRASDRSQAIYARDPRTGRFELERRAACHEGTRAMPMPDGQFRFWRTTDRATFLLHDLGDRNHTELDPFADGKHRHLSVHSLRVSPDGRSLFAMMDVSGDEWPEQLALFDLAEKRCKARQKSLFFYGQASAFSPDGAMVAYGAEGGFAVLDMADLKPRLIAGGHSASGLAFSPDGQRLAVGTTEGGVELWGVRAARQLAQMRATGWGARVEFYDGGRRLASVTAGGVRTWELAGTPERLALGGHRGGVSGVGFSPDGTMLASTGKDGVLRIWDPATGRAIRALEARTTDTQGCAFSPDGTLLAFGSMVGDGGLFVYRTRDWSPVHDQRHLMVESIRFSPDGSRLATATDDAAIVHRVREGAGGA